MLFGSLLHFAEGFKTAQAHKRGLLYDYARGLEYLHDCLAIMHRKINPYTLAVVDAKEPRGVITHFEDAKLGLTSTCTTVGHLLFMAPEMIALRTYQREWREDRRPSPPPYGHSIDLWALGLSMVAFHARKHFSMENRDP